MSMTESDFASINRSPKYTVQKNQQKNNYKRTKTLKRNTSEYSSTQSTIAKDQNRGRNSGGNPGKKGNIDSTTSSTSAKNSGNICKKIYSWCGQCCGRKKTKITKLRKSKKNFFQRFGKKKKKRASFSVEPSVSTVEYDPTVPAIKKHGKDERVSRFEDSKERERKSKKKRKKKHPSETSELEDVQDEQEMVKDVAQMDFSKSCCYLCAKNSMAIAAAISNKTEKLHMSIQASTKEIFTSDKSCSPDIQVRTVQSSVKVKVRDMGTHPEKRKDKKKKGRLNLKRLNNIIPKIKFPMYPKVRTVACETDKSIKCNNIPRCRAKRGTHCVTEANITENDKTVGNEK